MCGIAGFINLNNQKPDLAILKKMIGSISYRGPDDRGTELINNCAMGNCRLSVIDLSAKAHQPMWDTKKQFCLTYNGEIYNFCQLRSNLQRQGYRFKSNSDSEVVLNLYQEYGPDSLKKLRGMFALGIWDVQKKELFLARDQFGIKPLYYYRKNDLFIFASEIKSILEHPQVKRRLNRSALSYYFSVGFGCIPSPETIFENIFKLPPASYLVLNQNGIKIKKYWDISGISQKKIGLTEAVEETKRLIEKSVKTQLVADVPLGTFLSGGIDSSLVTYFAQKHTIHKIKTFSIGFEDKRFNESQYAQQVADFLKTDHYHQNFTTRELIDTLPEVVEKLDEPLADASILPTYLLSKYARKQVTVALSGDGGDELFAGYPTYLPHKFSCWLHCFPDPFVAALRKTLPYSNRLLDILPFLKHSPNLPRNYIIDRFFNGLSSDWTEEYLNFLGPMTLKEKSQLLLNHQELALPMVKELANRVRHFDRQTQLQYLDLKLFLAEDCLVKVDRASAYNSLEVRVPFLDTKLTEFVFSLPANYLLHGLTLKYLLKKVAAGLIPQNIIVRPKKGFGIPTEDWLKTVFKPLITSLLEPEKIVKQGFFNPEAVNRMLKLHLKGIQDNRMPLWNLLIFQQWYRKWFKCL
jgi:asparagine synthase (glutamine-hydrolysing)